MLNPFVDVTGKLTRVRARRSTSECQSHTNPHVLPLVNMTGIVIPESIAVEIMFAIVTLEFVKLHQNSVLILNTRWQYVVVMGRLTKASVNFVLLKLLSRFGESVQWRNPILLMIGGVTF